jgi:two-component system, chemotaxis family, protein-glutamate methylesterase/glutaminase
VIRVLIVDDSATTRQALAAVLQSDPEIKVIGQAVDGLDAIDLTARLAPDVITMDVNMPRMDGNEATRAIMAQMPTPILVVTSLSREELAFEGFGILLSGALDIVQKPSATEEQGFDAIGAEIIAKVKAVSQVSVKRKTTV